ncbi:DUF732 domain-containing protein [Mycobacterium avium]|uniref:DUF732 domain-containing protein n=1 Tax=Mycobacterium avium TaxID=1764 RepID=UPI0018C86481|nr:DUF732 domain-containing protein [Mycobacterium avium]
MTALLIALCSPAHAEPGAPLAGNPDKYLADLKSAGFDVSNKSVVMMIGLGVCVDIFQGATTEYEVNQLANIAGGGRAEAAAIVGAAQKDLCPKTLNTGWGRGI